MGHGLQTRDAMPTRFPLPRPLIARVIYTYTHACSITITHEMLGVRVRVKVRVRARVRVSDPACT